MEAPAWRHRKRESLLPVTAVKDEDALAQPRERPRGDSWLAERFSYLWQPAGSNKESGMTNRKRRRRTLNSWFQKKVVGYWQPAVANNWLILTVGRTTGNKQPTKFLDFRVIDSRSQYERVQTIEEEEKRAGTQLTAASTGWPEHSDSWLILNFW